jgi:hypothetical protein
LEPTRLKARLSKKVTHKILINLALSLVGVDDATQIMNERYPYLKSAVIEKQTFMSILKTEHNNSCYSTKMFKDN